MLISRQHQRMIVRTKVVKKITSIPIADWKKVYPDVLESYDFFKTLDDSHLEQFTFYYIMVYDHKTPMAAATCFLMNYSLDTSINGYWRYLSNSIKKMVPNIFSLKALICGMPLGQGRIGMNGPSDIIMQAIVRRMEQIARKNKAAIIAFKDFDSSYSRSMDVLRADGFSKFDSLPSAGLNIPFRNFEEYLKTLSGASRYDLRRKFKKVDKEVAIDLEIVDRVEGDTLKDVYRLYLNVVDKHEMDFELLPKKFFEKVSQNMPRQAKFFLWKIEKKLVAFLFCLVSDEVCADYYIGLDYSVAHKYHLYFIKFRDTLKWCIQNKIRRYEMGISGYEAKRRIGLDFVPLYLYVKLRNRVLRPVFNYICQFLKFENFDPDLKEVKRRMHKNECSFKDDSFQLFPKGFLAGQ